jgi:hypothetical protein
VEFLPRAVLFAPMAELLSPVAMLFAPSAELLSPVARLFAPSAALLFPVAMLFAPKAELLSPVAALLSPMAVPVAPTVAEPVSNTTRSPFESSDVELSPVCARPVLTLIAKLPAAAATSIPYRNRFRGSTRSANALSIFDAMTHTPHWPFMDQATSMNRRPSPVKVIM